MTPQRWARIKDVFGAAFELPQAEQSAFLDSTCAGDGELRAEVERLLEEGDDPSLHSPASGILNTAAELKPGDTVGHYRIESKLGEGGMSVVYRATDSRLGREVAIKFAKTAFSDRFEREARTVAALNHLNICTLHDVGPNYLVMELVEGPTLADRIKR
jgi:eukaryotic-like serine/threonine-protein kinase